jgi:NAD-dependent dihydropyrimidine dehydrogenase PreA subunit
MFSYKMRANNIFLALLYLLIRMGKRQKSFILIDTTKCTPCAGLICIGVCPQGALEEGKNGKPQIVDVAQCTRCGVCLNLCPAKAITMSNP